MIKAKAKHIWKLEEILFNNFFFSLIKRNGRHHPKIHTNIILQDWNGKVSRAYVNFLKFFCGFTFKLVYYLEVIL